MSELVDYGLRIDRGEIVDPGVSSDAVHGAGEADPWKLATWKKANPALGDFRSLEDVKRLALTSTENAGRRDELSEPHPEPAVRSDGTVHQCGRVEVMRRARFPITGAERPPVLCRSRLGATKDMTALVLVFAGERRRVRHRSVIAGYPARVCWKHRTATACRIELWAHQGHLLTFPGRTTDPKAVAMKIAELHGTYNIRALAYDRWRIEDLKRELDAIGCSVPLVPFGQGYKDLSPAVDVLERLVEEGKLRHGNHPVLAMAAANAKVELDAAGNSKLSQAAQHRPHRPARRSLYGARRSSAPGAGDRC